jgi:hypothetical protein
MALKLTASMRHQLVPPIKSAPIPIPEREEPKAAPDQSQALAEVQAMGVAADVRLARVLDAAVERIAEIQAKPNRYRMTHTFKRDGHGRIVSAETIVTPLESDS